ncbi:MAG: TolC family protein [Coxiellaceae bacterium]|nr:TolC family protein [Coxiellaceae bacterium]
MSSFRFKKLICIFALLLGFWAGALADDWFSNELALLPVPHRTMTQNQKMSMREAIMLALRNNPDVETAELARVSDKFSLMLAYNTFFPKYTLKSSFGTAPGETPSYSTSATMNIKSPIGTTVDTGFTRTYDGGPSKYTVNIRQPLLRGFGFLYNTIGLQNSKDDELKRQLDYKNNIITVTNTVIKNYRALVEDYNNLAIQKQTLKTNRLQYKQNLIRVKSGTMSESDLIQAKATLATFELSLVQTENSLQQDEKTLLTDLGLAPDVKFRIDQNIKLPPNYKVPHLNTTIAMAFAGNIDYLKRLIDLRVALRDLKKAKMDLWWQLDFHANNAWGYNGAGPAEKTPEVGLDLDIPINPLDREGTVLSDRINIINQQNNLAQAKRTLISNVTQALQNISSQLEQVKISVEQVALQQRTVHDTELKVKYGKSAMFELTTQQNTLLTNQTSLVSARVTLLNLITDLHTTLATTLDDWGIKLRY